MGHNIITLNVIPEPATNSRNIVTILLPEVTFFADDGDTNYVCGNCGATLANGIKEGIISNMVLKCNKCKSFNEFPEVD